MKLKDVIWLLHTDEFYIDVSGNIEVVHSYEECSFAAIRKYFNNEVKSIVPSGNSLDINLYPLT